MINEILLVAYVALIVLLSLKLRQGTFSGFAISAFALVHRGVTSGQRVRCML